MDNLKQVLSILLNSECINISSIIELAEYLRGRYRTTYSEFGFIIKNGTSTKQKTLKYTPANLKKLLVLNSADLLSVYFEKFKGLRDYQDPELSLNMMTSDEDSFPMIMKLIIDPELLCDLRDVLVETINMIPRHGFHMESAVAFTMQKSKMPMFFLSGIGTSEMTSEEIAIANALSINFRDYRRKIWDVFSYNLVKKQLLRPELVSEIADIVTPGNIIELGDKYIISLGDDGKGGAEAELRRERLRKLFQREDLIMYRKY